MITLLLLANIINIGADLGAMAAAVKLLIDGPLLLYVAAIAIGATALASLRALRALCLSMLNMLPDAARCSPIIATVFVVGVLQAGSGAR